MFYRIKRCNSIDPIETVSSLSQHWQQKARPKEFCTVLKSLFLNILKIKIKKCSLGSYHCLSVTYLFELQSIINKYWGMTRTGTLNCYKIFSWSGVEDLHSIGHYFTSSPNCSLNKRWSFYKLSHCLFWVEF